MNIKLIFKIHIIITTILLDVERSGANSDVAFPYAPPLAPTPPETKLVFTDQRLATIFPIIQKFKNIITFDPFNITATWAGGDVCNYTGFYCESPPDNQSATALASIDFNGFQLTAPTLEGFLDELPDLALFHANSNNFGGTIPAKIATLPYLYELDISNNNFSGPLPSAVVGMEELSFLDLRFNSFTGSVPLQLFSRGLDALFINNNFFDARLPDIPSGGGGGGGGTHISYLTMANNKFFGPIPRSISRTFSNISEILLLNNLLSGCLPYELGFLKEAVVVDAGGNRLTGPLPFSLGCLQNLEILNLAGNMLYGEVPEALCAVRVAANLSLSENYFTWVGPGCWRLIKSGVLDVRKNCIPGLPSQRHVAECAAFFARPRYCPYISAYIPCRPPQYAATDLPQLAPPPS